MRGPRGGLAQVLRRDEALINALFTLEANAPNIELALWSALHKRTTLPDENCDALFLFASKGFLVDADACAAFEFGGGNGCHIV